MWLIIYMNYTKSFSSVKTIGLHSRLKNSTQSQAQIKEGCVRSLVANIKVVAILKMNNSQTQFVKWKKKTFHL
uniref:Uncharacterized protein n=1 Tax=Glycine max TaxID=3847 RepID=A0A0R0HGN7_SOYBN